MYIFGIENYAAFRIYQNSSLRADDGAFRPVFDSVCFYRNSSTCLHVFQNGEGVYAPAVAEPQKEDGESGQEGSGFMMKSVQFAQQPFVSKFTFVSAAVYSSAIRLSYTNCLMHRKSNLPRKSQSGDFNFSFGKK